MEAAKVLAGYSLGEADLLAPRDGQEDPVGDGCAARALHRGAPERHRPAKANELFDLIDKFAGYGFNKSHAAAYALVAYHTAWLKGPSRPNSSPHR
jgi:DNA polymerase-3 subunit alpha